MEQAGKAQERIDCLTAIKAAVEARALKDYDFKHAVGSLPDDLQVVKAVLIEDPESWRLNRSFHNIHAPSLLAVMGMLNGLDGAPAITNEERQQVYVALHRACGLVSEARAKLDRAQYHKAIVELEVLADRAKDQKAPLQPLSAMRRRFEGVKAHVGKGKSAVVQSVFQNAAWIQGEAQASVGRLAGVPMLLRYAQNAVLGVVSDGVRRPIERRLQAGGSALRYGLGAGVGVGAATLLLFPPLLPMSAGVAALAAMQGWRSKMKAAKQLHGAEREERLKALRLERDAALHQLSHGEASFQIETEEINVTVNADTGHVDATVLSGAHAGRGWADLTECQRLEVLDNLNEGAAVIIGLLEFFQDEL